MVNKYHRKENINGKQILTEDKLKSKNEPKNKLKTVRLSKGGKVEQKKSPVKRIILWKGKAKNWPGAKKAAEQTRNKKADGGKINIKKVGSRKAYGKMLKKRNERLSKYRDNLDKPKWKKMPWKPGQKPKMQPLKKGGKADKNWIQSVNKSIKKRGTKGVCTGKKFGSASCPPGSKRYNLAKTFKKMARAKHASGGLVRFI